ncbi:hypothetical protein PAHAL_6G004900 [Panicum hallii]|uniref:protein-serine/threonine phosphatase n=1 Tax=Panicum hallii TaxID=206008 RepID=A0A2T8IEP3_9POAL|nr:hypothetical protein PAHAL_6G004900 [Panicum hallii]
MPAPQAPPPRAPARRGRRGGEARPPGLPVFVVVGGRLGGRGGRRSGRRGGRGRRGGNDGLGGRRASAASAPRPGAGVADGVRVAVGGGAVAGDGGRGVAPAGLLHLGGRLAHALLRRLRRPRRIPCKYVSTLCRDRMHEFLAEELAAEGAAFQIQQPAAAAAGEEAAAAASGTTSSAAVEQEEEEERAWRAALARTFRRVDALASLACACGRIVSPPCRCTLSGNSGIVGSTAVVAVLVRGRLVVANCGDSRAVLCRGPAGAPPVPLSVDHKPDRPDELARIEAAGGRVVYINGHRVRGILAMSRALASP